MSKQTVIDEDALERAIDRFGAEELTVAKERELEAQVRMCARKVRRYLSLSVQYIILAGLELRTAKGVLPHGQWTPWLQREFDWSPESARRFIRVAEALEPYMKLTEEAVAELAADQWALYDLARGDVPEEARAEAAAQLLQGRYLTRSVVAGIVERYDHEITKASFLQTASGAVLGLVEQHDPAAEVIPQLMRMEVQQPEAFRQLVSSGAVPTAGGGSIPLSEATSRDVDDWMSQERFESRMQRAVADGQSGVLLSRAQVDKTLAWLESLEEMLDKLAGADSSRLYGVGLGVLQAVTVPAIRAGAREFKEVLSQ